jgi:hypothetical protein
MTSLKSGQQEHAQSATSRFVLRQAAASDALCVSVPRYGYLGTLLGSLQNATQTNYLFAKTL